MNKLSKKSVLIFALRALLVAPFAYQCARADAVTDWNLSGVLATKGASSELTGVAGNALNSNLATRILAIEHRAIYDAINTISPIKSGRYYYYRDPSLTNHSETSATAAAAQAAHDVLVALVPVTPTAKWSGVAWSNTKAWLDATLDRQLAALGVTAQDAGVLAGKAAAQAAISARSKDGSSPSATFFPVLVASPPSIINNPSATISANVSVGARQTVRPGRSMPLLELLRVLLLE